MLYAVQYMLKYHDEMTSSRFCPALSNHCPEFVHLSRTRGGSWLVPRLHAFTTASYAGGLRISFDMRTAFAGDQTCSAHLKTSSADIAVLVVESPGSCKP
jgi:hypothetical protein